MEFERKIEKLLRAFAKKRREQAGDPIELHPVNRRLFQEEVARRIRKPGVRGAWFGWLGGLRPRVVAGFSALAVAAILIPELNKTQPEKQYAAGETEVSRRDELSPKLISPAPTIATAPASEPAASLAEGLAKDKSASESETRIAHLNQFSRLSLNPEKLPQSPQSNTELSSGSKFSNDEALEKNDLVQDSQKKSELAAPTLVASNPTFPITLYSRDGNTMAVTNETASLGVAAEGLPELQLERQQSATGAGQRFVPVRVQKLQGVAMTLPVLKSFELIQTGSEIQIVDADGSVYQGVIRSDDLRLRDSEIESLRNYSFRVSGTNRTLNQNIVFVGEISSLTNQNRQVATVTAANAPAAKPIGETQGFELLPLYDLRGTVSVGDGKETPIQVELAPAPIK